MDVFAQIEVVQGAVSAAAATAPIVAMNVAEAGIWIAVPLFVIGLLLILAEVFVPSGGALSILAVMAVVGSVVFAFLESVTVGFAFLGAVAVGVPITLVMAFKIFPNTPIGKRLIRTVDATTHEERVAVNVADKQLVGQIGTTVCPLVPGGQAEIAGVLRDVVTRGEMIDAKTQVQVVEVVGNRILVRAV